MLEVRECTGADVVAGRYQPVFERPPPRWMAGPSNPLAIGPATSFLGPMQATAVYSFRRPAFPPVASRSTSDCSWLVVQTRPSSGQSSGTGGKIVWSDEGVVIEHVPESRSSWRWLVKRKYRVGNNQSLFLLYFDNPSTIRKLKRLGGWDGAGDHRSRPDARRHREGTELVRGARRPLREPAESWGSSACSTGSTSTSKVNER